MSSWANPLLTSNSRARSASPSVANAITTCPVGLNTPNEVGNCTFVFFSMTRSIQQEFPIWPTSLRILMLLLPSTQGIYEQSKLQGVRKVPTARSCPSDEPRLLPRNPHRHLLSECGRQRDSRTRES